MLTKHHDAFSKLFSKIEYVFVIFNRIVKSVRRPFAVRILVDHDTLSSLIKIAQLRSYKILLYLEIDITNKY